MTRRCTKCTCQYSIDDWSGGDNKKSGYHVTPTRKLELSTITKLFEYVKSFTLTNRKIKENWLCGSYKVKPTKDTGLSTHEARAAEVFNTISTSDSHLPYEETDDNGNSSSAIDQEQDVPTYNSTIGEVTLDDTVNNIDELLVHSDSTDKDATTALRSVSKLKKYKIAKTCVHNVIEVG